MSRMSLPGRRGHPGHIDYTEFLAATLDRSISGGISWGDAYQGYFSRVPCSERLVQIHFEAFERRYYLESKMHLASAK